MASNKPPRRFIRKYEAEIYAITENDALSMEEKWRALEDIAKRYKFYGATDAPDNYKEKKI